MDNVRAPGASPTACILQSSSTFLQSGDEHLFPHCLMGFLKKILSSISRLFLGEGGFVCVSLLSPAWPEMIPRGTWGHLEQSCCSLGGAAVGQSWS